MRHGAESLLVGGPLLTSSQPSGQGMLLPPARMLPPQWPRRRRRTPSGLDPLELAWFRFLLNAAADFDSFREQLLVTLLSERGQAPKR